MKLIVALTDAYSIDAAAFATNCRCKSATLYLVIFTVIFMVVLVFYSVQQQL